MAIKSSNSFLAVALAIASLSFPVSVKADTVNARCDVFPKGEDRATSSGPCTFSQRQGAVSIQLENGNSYDLIPSGNRPGNYRDRNGNAAYRQSGLGDRGQIYRLANESIFVYWDTSANGQNSGNRNQTAAARRQPEAGTTVSRLSDLVGARAGQAENTVKKRGYRWVKSDDSGYSYWLEGKTNYCVTIQTDQGRYQSIVYTGNSEDCKK
ncbi:MULTISPECIES: hypothetical protein [unclassified Nostoc]|uniref:hypothetical protein n=1 Tax=unclassified Nostoc TaxID=2593658 RepID=UPI002AD39D72|nr:hypothetical protein [Nostoc sp. DedQUE03]MDZ7975716.1 hypothetical protein [Nostoc sp. DedQUE03]MDZ8048419.1 hypothetical protein [Nostoc sp. DedQUE02]